MLKKIALAAVLAVGSTATFADNDVVVVLVHKFGLASLVKSLKF